MTFCARCFAVLLVSALPLFGATPSPAPAPLAFEITFPKELSASPVDGHIILVISRNGEQEPRFGVAEGFGSQQAFGVDVDGWHPGAAARVDGTTLGYPLVSLNELEPGDYYVQAVLNVYETYHLGNGKTIKLPPDRGEGQHWQTKPGNFLSKVQKLHLDPKTSGVVKIAFDHKVPPLEQELADVESQIDWHHVTQPENVDDNQWVKHIRLQSELLTKFWGRPTEIGAVVLVPDGFDEHPNAHYPVLISEDHYHRHYFPSFRITPPDASLKGSAEYDFQQSGWKMFQDWTSGRLPRVLIVMPQHANPYFDDSYAVNSENLGPYGDAIMRELLPAIEKQFRGIGQGWARAVFGGSTGGWEALGVQVFYPDFFGGAWSLYPDPIDFRAYSTVNIYEDKSAYFREGPFGKVPRPEKRKTNGILDSTLEQENRFELVLGTHSRSGEQFDIWEAVFSPMG